MKRSVSKEGRKSAPAKDVDAYIAAAPKEARAMLKQLRKIIKVAAPKADEGINYQIPFYKYRGPLVAFAAFKNHCSFYVTSSSFLKAYKNELKAYETAKGTVRFPIGKPLPVALVKKLVKARIAENETRGSG